jgi:hypothetical protein
VKGRPPEHKSRPLPLDISGEKPIKLLMLANAELHCNSNDTQDIVMPYHMPPQ